jgi:hypothetical protein
MMGSLIGVAVLGALLVWFLGVGKSRPVVAPEDDVTTPVDTDELAEAEAELAEDPSPRPIHEALEDDDDDWGPGTSRSNLPGII